MNIAKTYAVCNFVYSEKDVIAVVDYKSCFYYYHPKYKVWYKGLNDKKLKFYFSWLVSSDNNVPSSASCLDILPKVPGL